MPMIRAPQVRRNRLFATVCGALRPPQEIRASALNLGSNGLNLAKGRFAEQASRRPINPPRAGSSSSTGVTTID